MAYSNRLRALALLAVLALVTASPALNTASSVNEDASGSKMVLLADSAIGPAPSSDTIAVPRVTLGSILSAILKWPSNILSGFGSSTASRAASSSVNGNTVFSSASGSTDTSLGSSTSGPSTSSANSQLSTGSQIFEPLTDAGIAAINRLLAGNQSIDGPYHFNTGLPPLQDLVIINTTAQQTASTLSADRMKRLAHLSEPLGWLIRSFSVSGDALLKLKLSTDLQLIIRDVVSNSIAASAAVPEEQVLTFATSNVTISLGFDGVHWPSTAADATAEQHPGLAAVRTVLSLLSDGFDPEHIRVSFQHPIAAENAAGGTPGRRMLQATAAIAAATNPQQQQVVVCATFHSLDPANSTSLLEALGRRCSTASQNSSSSSTGNPLFAPLTALAPGANLTASCMAHFEEEFIKQGVSVSSEAFAITPVHQPQATVDLSVAVGLTSAQTLNHLDQKTGEWLNSTTLNDILSEFNLTAVPTDFTEFVYDPVTGRFPEIPGLNLSSVMAKLMTAVPALDGNTAVAATGSESGGRAAVLGTAIIAGVTVAAVTSLLALAGVLYLLVRHRRAASEAEEGQLPTSTGGAPGTSDSNRRRRRRLRMYNNKYISGADTAGHNSDTAASQSDTIPAVAEQPKHRLERGDSVSSAVKFEVEEPETLDSESGTPTSAAAESSSSRDSDIPQQQRVVELQLYRAAGPSHGSGAASAHSLVHDGLGSSALTDMPGISHSRLLMASGPDVSAGNGLAPLALMTATDGVVANRAHLIGQQQTSCGAPHGVPDGLITNAGNSLAGPAYSMQRSMSATLLADAAAAVLAQKELARSQSAAAQSYQVCSNTRWVQASAAAVHAGDHCDADSAPLHPRTIVVSATSTPPATPDGAAVFAAMDAQLTAAARSIHGCSSSGERVQPLGASCWHSRGHESGFLVPEGIIAATCQGADTVNGQQHQDVEQLLPRQQQQRPHISNGWVSPFSMAEHQQCSRTSSCGPSSRVAAEQHASQSRQSCSSDGAIMLLPSGAQKQPHEHSGEQAATGPAQQQQ